MENVTQRLNKVFEAMKDGDAAAIPYYLALLILLKRSYYYRYLKKGIVPAGLLALTYRIVNGADSHLLSLVSKWISSCSLGGHQLKNISGDICGAIVLGGLVHFSEDVLSVFRLLLRPNLKKTIINALFEIIKPLPPIQKQIKEEFAKKTVEFEQSFKAKTREYNLKFGPSNVALPLKGKSQDEIISMMTELCTVENTRWQEGKVTGSVYHGSKSHQEFLNKAFGIYSLGNPLHADIWPSGIKYESEVVAMTANMMRGGDPNVCGCTTSGGTESIILGIKAHRDYYRQEYGITEPEMIACISAHAAVNKACDMMGIKLILVPMDPVTYKVDVNAVRRAVGPNTIMMYASAPNYAQGVIDPIREMGAIAVQYNIGLHVDCCLGGFVLPFAKKLGYNLPDFDFSVPGVTSMSVDTHKYGYTLKGISVLLYRNASIRAAGYFCYSECAIGMYTTPTIAGSRSLGMISQAWACLMTLGEEGYLKHVGEIMETVKKLADGIRRIPGLKLLGNAEAMIVCFTGVGDINVYTVVDEMSKRGGWGLGSHQHPPCAHLCVTVPHVGFEEAFLNDLRASVDAVSRNPDAAKHGNAVIYGTSSQMPTGPVDDILKIYNDVTLSV